MRSCLEDLVVPVRVSFTTASGAKIQDTFAWRADAPQSAVHDFATLLCNDQAIDPSEHQDHIVHTINQQVKQHMQILDSVKSRATAEQPRLETLRISVLSGNNMLRDTLVWDVHNRQADFAAFAKSICQDLGMPDTSRSAVECELLSKVYEHLQQDGPGSHPVTAVGEIDDTERPGQTCTPGQFDRPGMQLHSVYTMGIARKREEWPAYTAVAKELTAAEVDAIHNPPAAKPQPQPIPQKLEPQRPLEGPFYAPQAPGRAQAAAQAALHPANPQDPAALQPGHTQGGSRSNRRAKLDVAIDRQSQHMTYGALHRAPSKRDQRRSAAANSDASGGGGTGVQDDGGFEAWLARSRQRTAEESTQQGATQGQTAENTAVAAAGQGPGLQQQQQQQTAAHSNTLPGAHFSSQHQQAQLMQRFSGVSGMQGTGVQPQQMRQLHPAQLYQQQATDAAQQPQLPASASAAHSQRGNVHWLSNMGW